MSSETQRWGKEGTSITPNGAERDEKGNAAAIKIDIGNADGDGDNIAGEEVENGKREMVKMADPKLPSEAEIEEHSKTHLPFRNWC